MLIDNWKTSWKFYSSAAAILIGFLNGAIASNFYGLFKGWTVEQVAALNAVLVGLLIPALRAIKQHAEEKSKTSGSQAGFARPGLLLAMAATLLIGCGSMEALKPKSFDDQLAAATKTSTFVLKSTTVLLKAGKISKKDAQNVLEQSDLAMAGVTLAREIKATDPAGAETKLGAALKILMALDAYLTSKGATP